MKTHSFKESFSHAVDGFFTTLREERNMRFHVIMTVLVIVCSVLFNLTVCEKAIVISLCFLVLCAELINTAIENAIDLFSPTYNLYAKKAKDAASGGVLVLSVGAAICGIIIFLPYGIKLIQFLIK